MLDATSACVRKFAMQVAEHYIALLAPDQRQVPFRWGVTIDDLCKAERHNAQIISRYMDGTVKVLPADLEDAWLLALPEPYRGACERDLARRRGTLAVKLLAAGESDEAVGMGQLAVEFGQLFEALAQAGAGAAARRRSRRCVTSSRMTAKSAPTWQPSSRKGA